MTMKPDNLFYGVEDQERLDPSLDEAIETLLRDRNPDDIRWPVKIFEHRPIDVRRKPLPAHLEIFVGELLVPRQSARQAAIKAGCPEKSAPRYATVWKQREDVQARINEVYHYQSLRYRANADRVMAELSRTAFSDARRFLNDDDELVKPSQWDADDAAAVKELEIDDIKEPDGQGGLKVVGKKKKLKLHDKMGALRILAAHHRLMDEASGPKVVMNVNIQL